MNRSPSARPGGSDNRAPAASRGQLDRAGARQVDEGPRLAPSADRRVPERELGARPNGGGRDFDNRVSRQQHGSGARPAAYRPPHRTNDVRYARPTTRYVRTVGYAYRPVPVTYTYRPYYTRWYCHPWYRYRYSTWAVVSFDFWVYPWYNWWAPPMRYGWDWVPGGWSFGYWHPGYWVPATTVAIPFGYVYVPGWWEGDVYVDGYYRVDRRDGWVWVDGYYTEDGGYVRGHWEPQGGGPAGYIWEGGFWDGNEYVDGFWRPEYLDGYAWVNAYYDADGIYRAGYWMPVVDQPGYVWVPGWFDGNEWVSGYWVPEAEYRDDALLDWEPPAGYDDGWDDEMDPRGYAPEAQIRQRTEETGEAPLAIPVVPQ